MRDPQDLSRTAPPRPRQPDGPTEMDRLKRLQALQAQKNSTQAAGRRRVQAKILHVHDPAGEANEERMRAELKEMALQKRREEDRRRLEMEKKQAEEAARAQAAAQETAKAYETESEYSDDESEEEEEQILLKPVFVPKEARQTVATLDPDEDPEEVQRRDQEERQREAHALLADYVRMERSSKKKTGDDITFEANSGAFDPLTVDDTDGLDEEAEFQAWKLRELLRIKRDREEREAREREQIEMERVRNLTEEEKQEIDREKQAEWNAKPKGEYKFLQKYYHKGAFFGDVQDSVVQRDYTAPTGEDLSNKEFLPESMQVKNFGKRGRTKWTHLTNEDTTEFRTGWGQKANETNYRMVGKMAGMRGDLARPSAKHRKNG